MLILQELVRTQISRTSVALEVLCSCGTSTQTTKPPTGVTVLHLLISHSAQKLTNPQSSGVTCSSARGQDVIGTDALSYDWSAFVHLDLVFSSIVPRYRLTLSPYETQVPSPKNSAP